jgi:signal transduction histidine kinase
VKFSWKILLNTFIWVLIALSIGGTLLISISFNKSILEARENIIDKNQMQKVAIATLMSNYNRLAYENEDMAIKAVLRTLETNWEHNNGLYRVRYWNGDVLSEMNPKDISWNIQMPQQSEKQFNHAIYKIGDSYYLQGISCLILNKETIVIENMEDVSGIFETRETQSKIFFRITLVIGMLAAICNYFFTKWLTASIKELEDVTSLVAKGDLGARVKKISNDEIGSLSRKFNVMAETLENNMEELKEESTRQKDFVGSFSHELKTPLTSIIGYADLLRTHKVDEETRFEAANYIFLEGKRLENLSLKMLELLVERNKELEYKYTSIKQLVTEVLVSMKSRIDEKETKLQLDMESINSFVDADLMKTVIMNLLDNAIKAVDEKGIISIILTHEGEEFVMRVTDNGCGIPKEDVSRLTEAFYMVDKSRSRSYGGVGLGLSICKQIMELHNGRIEFESEEGKGTKASIRWKEKE